MSVFISLKSCFDIENLNLKQKSHRKTFSNAQSVAFMMKPHKSKNSSFGRFSVASSASSALQRRVLSHLLLETA